MGWSPASTIFRVAFPRRHSLTTCPTHVLARGRHIYHNASPHTTTLTTTLGGGCRGAASLGHEATTGKARSRPGGAVTTCNARDHIGLTSAGKTAPTSQSPSTRTPGKSTWSVLSTWCCLGQILVGGLLCLPPKPRRRPLAASLLTSAWPSTQGPSPLSASTHSPSTHTPHTTHTHTGPSEVLRPFRRLRSSSPACSSSNKQQQQHKDGHQLQQPQ